MGAADDKDLEDLLGSGSASHDEESMPLNLDHLAKGELDTIPKQRRPGLASLIGAHISYCCDTNPVCCACLLVGMIVFGTFFAIALVVNPTERFGIIGHDYSGITSQSQLSISTIDHWCIGGDNDSCVCEDPLEPVSRMEFKSWSTAHIENKNRVQAFQDSDLLDVAFVGESLVEEMDGRWMGRAQSSELKAIEGIFDRNFKRKNSGMDGVALGIAGDTSPHVLWRLMHGEMPPNFNPRVWWVSLGMNDLGRMRCSEEVVVMGILRVVEEIRNKKPDAHIVINSVIPMADLRGGVYPNLQDYRDAFRNKRGRLRQDEGEKKEKEILKAIELKHPELKGRVVGGDLAQLPKRYVRPINTTTVWHKHLASRKFPDGKPLKVDASVPPAEAMAFAKKQMEKRARAAENGAVEVSPPMKGPVIPAVEKEEPKKVDPKKEEPKKEEPKKEEPKKVEPKKEEPKKEEPKKEEPKKEEPKKEEPKKEEPKKEEPKKEEPKKVEPKKEEPKKEEPKKEEPKKVEPKKEEPKKVEPKKEEPKKEEPKKETDTQKRFLAAKKDNSAGDDNAKGMDQKQVKKLMKQIKKDPVNPKLDLAKNAIKKRDAKSLFMKRNKLPIWTAIDAINKELRKFCENDEKITFFDAGKIFTEKIDRDHVVLKTDLISVRGHPTEEGFAVFEDKIAAELKKIFEKQDEEFAHEAEEGETG